MRHPKVLVVASWYPSDASPVAGIFIQRHASAARQVAEVAVAYVEGREGVAAGSHVTVGVEDGLFVARGSYSHSRRGSNALQPILYVSALRRCLQAIRREFGAWDIMHVQVALPAGAAVFLVPAGAPVVITEHWSGYAFARPGFDSLGFHKKALIRLVYRRASRVTAVSGSLGAALVKRGLCRAFDVLPNVIPGEAFDAFRASHGGKGAGRKKLIHVSLLNELKNVPGILRAVARLAAIRDDFELVIVGDGETRAGLEAYARVLGLDNVVSFVGLVTGPRLYELMRSAVAHVSFSHVETFSVVTAEALACGTPVIVTRCGGPEEFVDERSGIIISPGDEAALVRAIAHMLDHGSEYDRQHLHDRAKALFAPAVVTQRLADLYHSLLSR